MKFSPAFYIINGWPSVEKTIEMVDKYVDHGVNAIQICMPSSNPYGEYKFIQERMKHAIDKYGLNYDVFMDCIREIRKRHPKIEFHQVLYNDVADRIGLEKFADYCLEVQTYTVMVDNNETADYLNSRGVRTTDFLHYDMPEFMVERAVRTKNLVMLRSNSRYEDMEPREGLATWKQRIEWLRKRGVEGPIYPVSGISTKEQLQEVKDAGADGAYIGTALMELWEDEDKLWEKLDSFRYLTEAE